MTRRKTASQTAAPGLRAAKLKPDAIRRWANVGIALTLSTSAVLNGYANAAHADLPWAGWLLGLATPALVFVLCRIAALQWACGRRQSAKFTAGTGVSLLLLSVWHCSQSIAGLTASPLFLSLPLAVAVDVGLIASEWASADVDYH
jgi:hypothetical protein